MPTIKELAAYVGVSVSTVSLVLRGEAGERKISQATQEKVWRAAQELGYQPNISARRLRHHGEDQKLVIAVFWARDFRAPMVVRFLRGIQDGIIKNSHNCEIIMHPYTINELEKEMSLKEMNLFHAAIVCNATKKDMEFLENADIRVPVVLYNRPSDRFNTVTIDDRLLGAKAAEVFASRGHKHAAVLSAEPVFEGMDDRIDSFCQTCKSAGMTVDAVLEQENSMAGGFFGASGILSLPALPDCLFCASDAIAVGALKAFHDAGIRIPDDLELISVGNGDKELEEYSIPSLSIVHVPMEKMAGICLELLIEITKGQADSRKSVEMPVRYISRESCGEMAENPPTPLSPQSASQESCKES